MVAVSNEICKLADMAECVRLLHADDAWRAAAEQAVVHIGRYVCCTALRPIMFTHFRTGRNAQHRLEIVHILEEFACIVAHRRY